MTPKRTTSIRHSLEANYFDVFTDVVNGVSRLEIARKYKVTETAVSLFKTRHAATIESALAETAYRNRETLIADKSWRVSEYAQLYDAAKEALETAEAHSDKALMMKEARGSLKAVAEELGQLPRSGDTNIQHMQVLIRQYNGDTEGI